MPLKIIRADITKIKCDAIVNPTNEDMYPGGGVDECVHRVAGEELLKDCRNLGYLRVGEARITPAYKLPCKFVIHTVGPWWSGGTNGEKESLESCYKQSLKMAVATKSKSVAFPLISSGTYGYPKDQVLKIALNVIKEFLNDYDMLVYLVVYDKASYELSKPLAKGIERYIHKTYLSSKDISVQTESGVLKSECKCASVKPYALSLKGFEEANGLEEMIEEGFAQTLLKYVDAKQMSDVVCYKKANVSRQTWHKIVSDKNYTPTKNTVISFAIALELTLEETQRLLETTGYVLSRSSLFDVIITYCISNSVYDVLEIDAILFKYDQDTLFSKA